MPKIPAAEEEKILKEYRIRQDSMTSEERDTERHEWDHAMAEAQRFYRETGQHFSDAIDQDDPNWRDICVCSCVRAAHKLSSDGRCWFHFKECEGFNAKVQA